MKKIIAGICLFCCLFSFGQENITYQKPSEEILDLVNSPLAPSIRIDKKGEHIVSLFRDQYKTLKDLSETELRLAGLRINPKTNIGSRVRFYNNIEVKNIKANASKKVTGLPSTPKLSNFVWSPDQSKMAFNHTNDTGMSLWILEIKSAKAHKISDYNLNANMGRPFQWLKDNKTLLCKVIPNNKKELINTLETIPTGPTISTNNGKKAQNRTYQDLLKNKFDEHNFEQLALSEIYTITTEGTKKLWKEANIYSRISSSPDGKHFLITTISKPFSYLVPYSKFPSTTAVYNAQSAQLVKEIVDVPLVEDLPKGFMAVRTGKRSIGWRGDQPATLYWVEAIDGGDPNKEFQYRDEIFMLSAPFNNTPKSLAKTQNRFRGITWGNDTVAILYDYWWNTRNTKTYLINPSTNNENPSVLFDRNYQDKYNDPGDFVTDKNDFGVNTLVTNKNNAYLIGDGYSKEGKFPFVNEINLNTKKIKTIYRSAYKDKVENLIYALDIKKGNVLISLESKKEYPNYYIRNIKKGIKLTKITDFSNPFKSIQNAHKEVINYKREDGLDLSGTLYLPTNYEKGKKYPMILWAYPREYKDRKSAGQTTSNSNQFTYPWYGSPIYWISKGYVVLDNAAFPIIGEGNEEPNDTFMKQLVGNAKAAIDAVDNLGYIDRNRVAVGGHSYGAFMTANLLTHSNLFAAGIARSGAYNRTLTPFGFQSEERNYWEAPNIYYNMSPFMHADKMKTPLLLIHGEADNNSGTYPMQSKRYFNALKGLGATVRLVMLPKESHGYAAKESILHMLWEQDQWLEKHVKNKTEVPAEGTK